MLIVDKNINISIYLTMALVMSVLLIGLLFERQSQGKLFIRRFSGLILVDIIMLVSEAALCFFDGNVEYIMITKVCALFSYSSGYAMVCFIALCLVDFINDTITKVEYTFAYIVVSFFVLLIVLIDIAILCDKIFYFDETGTMQYTKYQGLVNVFSVVSFLSAFAFVLKYRKELGKKAASFSFFGILPLLAMPLLVVWDTLPIYIMVSILLVLLNNLFRKEISLILIEREKQLMESRVSNLISQIQPHFVFNTLNTIKFLCKTDAELARKTIDSYSVFLRGSIESMTLKECIPFEREIDIVQNYLFVEKQRFGEDLKIETDFSETSFFLPALSLQPIVENAVRHGIRKKRGGGTVRITSSADEENYIVTIADDGVGFVKKSNADEEGTHVGLKNVADRLRLMANGKLEIKSTQGVGTTVVITIPRTSNQKQ